MSSDPNNPFHNPGFSVSFTTWLVFRNTVGGTGSTTTALYASRAEFRDSSSSSGTTGQLWTPSPLNGAQTYTITADTNVSTLNGMVFRTYNQYQEQIPPLSFYFYFGGQTSSYPFGGSLGLAISLSGTYTPKGLTPPGGTAQSTADQVQFTLTPPANSASAFIGFSVMFTAASQNFISPDPQICLEGNG